MPRRLRLLAMAVAVLALVAAGCGDDDAGDLVDPTLPTVDEDLELPLDGDEDGDEDGDAADQDAPVLQLRESEQFGPVLGDTEGFALYAFTDDEEGVSNCTEGCADIWPPLTVDGGEVPVADGVDESLVSTITRDDGSTQVAYAGHPLYRYGPDTSPAEATGQGAGGRWFQVTPDGELAM